MALFRVYIQAYLKLLRIIVSVVMSPGLMNKELKDMDTELGFHEKILMILFLRGLGDDFKLVRDMLGTGKVTWKLVALTLNGTGNR